MEYQEVQIPEDILKRLENAATSAAEDSRQQPMTFGEAGVFDWLNTQAEDGWRVVWQAFNFPFIVFEREIVIEN